MKFNIGKLLFFDIETVSQYNDLFDMPDRQLKMWESYYDSFRKKVTDESKYQPKWLKVSAVQT